MITQIIPDTWQNLQTETARILEECGFNVEVEKKVQTPRETVEIDVYAEETINGRKYSIAVECKHWKSRIPQTIIHGFRTVVSEIGANVGYIVSMNGFQSGAVNARKSTNIELLTWQQLQEIFLKSWYENYLTNRIKELSPLMTLSEPFFPAWFEKLSKEDKEVFCEYKSRYDTFGMIAQSFGPWGRILRKNEPIPTLPLSERLTDEAKEQNVVPENILNESYYREFLEKVLAHGNYVLGLYHKLRNKYETGT